MKFQNFGIVCMNSFRTLQKGGTNFSNFEKKTPNFVKLFTNGTLIFVGYSSFLKIWFEGCTSGIGMA